MPSPHEDELRLLASPVPAHTRSGFFCHTATAPMDWTGCLSKTGLQVVPWFAVLKSPPVPVATKNVAGRFSTTAKSETRPPQFAGPTERQVRSRNSPDSSAGSGPGRAAAEAARGVASATSVPASATARTASRRRSPPRRGPAVIALLDVQQLDLEHQRRVRG